MKKQLFFLVMLLCIMCSFVHAQQRKVLFEEFTSSSCPPCATMNAWLNPLLETNADKIVVVKYQMNWPGVGDPYCTSEGLQRRAYYALNSVPYPYTNGVFTNSSSAIQNAINTGYAQPAQADITGTVKVTGNTITISGSVTPLISGSGYKIHISVDEKMTKNNKTTNGEKEFHHVMMKMFPNGNGTDVTLTAGTAIPFSYTYDMSSTHVEEMDDLEVAVFVQNTSTKAVLNAAYLEDITPAPQNVTVTQATTDSKTVNITWGNPPAGADGYNIYRDGVKLNSALVTTTSYQDEAPEYGKTYMYAVEIIVDGVAGYKKSDEVLINVTIPAPFNVTAKQIRGLNMLVTWELPETEYPVKYYIYRNNVNQNPQTPVSETTFESVGLTYREYCFEIEPFVNEIKGARTNSICITLINIPAPNNLKAEQLSIISKEVLLTWGGSTSNTAGYNIYRDNVKINTELVTSQTYTDAVLELDKLYTYQIFGVAETGAESEKSAGAQITLSDKIPVPQNVQVTNNDLNVTVSWNAVSMNIDGYNIYRNDEKINSEPVTEINYSDIVPEEGNYCYKITTVLEGVEGDKSDPKCENIILGISDIDKDALFLIYPNPVSGILNIDTKEIITDCKIYNSQGQLIYSNQTNTKDISTESWASGAYIISITTNNGTAEKRFVKN
ncbi:MAG: T9SS type A sorting domain-containing protein [Lentimicrobiaceae bacterium]|nr:T9SS type A sorting domain-containing protein [Lentimicrobiaceae bacterium]